MSTKLRPQTVKNRKNIGIELRRTHYNLGNDGKYLLLTLNPHLFRLRISILISSRLSPMAIPCPIHSKHGLS